MDCLTLPATPLMVLFKAAQANLNTIHDVEAAAVNFDYEQPGAIAAVCYTEIAMKVLVLYRPNSEHGRLVEEFIHEFQSRHPTEHLEIMSIDTRDGSAMASLYDIMRYPAILVTQMDGSIQRSWEGETLPLMDEVAAYARG